MARLAERLDGGTDRRGRSALVACAEGELHALGGRMVADFLDADGWDVLFVGALSPVERAGQYAAERGVDVVALSASLSRAAAGGRGRACARCGLSIRRR